MPCVWTWTPRRARRHSRSRCSARAARRWTTRKKRASRASSNVPRSRRALLVAGGWPWWGRQFARSTLDARFIAGSTRWKARLGCISTGDALGPFFFAGSLHVVRTQRTRCGDRHGSFFWIFLSLVCVSLRASEIRITQRWTPHQLSQSDREVFGKDAQGNLFRP